MRSRHDTINNGTDAGMEKIDNVVTLSKYFSIVVLVVTFYCGRSVPQFRKFALQCHKNTLKLLKGSLVLRVTPRSNCLISICIHKTCLIIHI